MGNPFGKIIQNGVEYDVSQYAHKIVVTGSSGETNATLMSRIWTALKAKVSDVTTIKSATLVINGIFGSTSYQTYHLEIANQTEIRFNHYDVGSSAVNLRQLVLADTPHCYFAGITASEGNIFRDDGSRTMTRTVTCELYYT